METKESLIEKIDYSECALKKMNEYLRRRHFIEDVQLSAALRERDEIEKSKIRKYTNKGAIIYLLIRLASVFGVIYFVPYLLYTYFGFNSIDKAKVMIVTCWIIGGIVLFIANRANRMHYQNVVKPQLLKEADDQIEKVTQKLNAVSKEISDYVATDEWKTALSYVPKDYFYMTALEKFKFYLENGHADNMKEALKLYDEFVHRKKLEKEARRAADNSAEAAEYAKITSEKAASAEFWTLVNAYTTEEIYRKLQ